MCWSTHTVENALLYVEVAKRASFNYAYEHADGEIAPFPGLAVFWRVRLVARFWQSLPVCLEVIGVLG